MTFCVLGYCLVPEKVTISLSIQFRSIGVELRVKTAVGQVDMKVLSKLKHTESGCSIRFLTLCFVMSKIKSKSESKHHNK